MFNNEINFDFKKENNQISLTGGRVIVTLIALIQSPKTFEELREFILNSGFSGLNYSIEMARQDISTLREIGCDISKATKSNNFKYIINNHPFSLKISSYEINILKYTYNKMIKFLSISEIIDYHELFNKIAMLIKDENLREELYSISLLKSIDIEMLKNLLLISKKENKIRILYTNGGTQQKIEYEISIDKIGVRNNKFYIYCYNYTLKKRSMLNLSRVNNIIYRMLKTEPDFSKDIFVKFKLINFQKYNLDENENIIEKNDNYIIVNGSYYNKFNAIQRILSFSSDCFVIEPTNIKSAIIFSLKKMRAQYE